MVFTTRLSDGRIAAARSDIDEELARLRAAGFLKPTKTAKPRTGTVVQQKGKSTRAVVVEKKAAPRITEQQKRERLKAEEAQRKEKLMAEQARKRQEEEARKSILDPALPLERRIAAAEFLGYKVAYRGPQEHPRAVVFWRQGGDRIVIALPKGKNARLRFGIRPS